MTLLVRDEIDIIGRNIEFHLAQGVDAIVAIDNGSIDGTREVLEEYQRQGVLHLLDEPVHDFSQSRWVTRAAFHARDHLGADWALNNDADEFWTVPKGSLKDIIPNSNTSVLLCRRLNMLSAYEELGSGDWSKKLTYRVADPVPRPKLNNFYSDGLPCPFFYLDLPPKALVRTKGLIKVGQGNHNAQYTDGLKTSEEVPIEIFHFPIQSLAQFEKKIIQGGRAYQANLELPEGMGWHWRRWYRMLEEGGLNAPLADALPSREKLVSDVRDGVVVEDLRFHEMIEPDALSAKAVERQ